MPVTAKVMIVDDEEMVLSAHRRILSAAGHEVLTASDGPTALKLLEQHELDVILTDIAMPEMSGTELLQHIREQDLHVPVVFITGAPALETAVQAVEHGAFRYLLKPVDIDELRDTVDKAVRLRRLTKVKHEALDLLGTAGSRVSDRAGLAATFAKGMEQLWLAFQPIVDWKAKSIYGYEALLRTTEPAIPHPGEFISIAERLDKLDELGRAVRRRAAADLPAAPGSPLLFVNLHPQDLLDDDLFAAEAPLSAVASRVVLEVTERASIDNITDIRDRVSRLKKLGFRIAVDDLGAGYAGLNNLAHLEPEVVKVDMGLIRDIDKSATKEKLVRSLVELSSELGMTVVGEGVETPAERDTLAKIGCRIMQGYHFAKPDRPFVEVDW